MSAVIDTQRPDVNGIPSKMQAICDEVKKSLEGSLPFLVISTSDFLGSSVYICGATTTKEEWSNGILENATYCKMFIKPKSGRYYHPDDALTVEVISGNCPKFRKYTGTLDKVIGKVKTFIETMKAQ